MLQKKSAPEILADAAYAGQRDSLKQPSARAGLGLPVAAGTGGGFALLPNPRAAHEAVPQERIVQARAEAEARAAQEHAAASRREKQAMGDQDQDGGGRWSPGRATAWQDEEKTENVRPYFLFGWDQVVLRCSPCIVFVFVHSGLAHIVSSLCFTDTRREFVSDWKGSLLTARHVENYPNFERDIEAQNETYSSLDPAHTANIRERVPPKRFRIQPYRLGPIFVNSQMTLLISRIQTRSFSLQPWPANQTRQTSAPPSPQATRDDPGSFTGWGSPAVSDRKEDPGSGWGDPVGATGWGDPSEPGPIWKSSGTGWKSPGASAEGDPANESGWGEPVEATGWGDASEPEQTRSPGNKSGTGWHSMKASPGRRPANESDRNITPEDLSGAAKTNDRKEVPGSGWDNPGGATGWGNTSEPEQAKSPGKKVGTGWKSMKTSPPRGFANESDWKDLSAAAARRTPAVYAGRIALDDSGQGACSEGVLTGTGWGSPTGWGADDKLEGDNIPGASEERPAEGDQALETDERGRTLEGENNEPRTVEDEKTSREREDRVGWAAPQDATWQAASGALEEEASLGAWGTGAGATGWGGGNDGDEVKSACQGDHRRPIAWDEVAGNGSKQGKRVRGVGEEQGAAERSVHGLSGTAEGRPEKKQRPGARSEEDAIRGGEMRSGQGGGNWEKRPGQGAEGDPFVKDLWEVRNRASTVLRR